MSDIGIEGILFFYTILLVGVAMVSVHYRKKYEELRAKLLKEEEAGKIKQREKEKEIKIDEDNGKMEKGFHITSVCRNDIIQMIEDQMDDGDELKAVMLIKAVENITDREMGAIASNLSDNFCDCCFWDSLENVFKRIVAEKNG